MTACAKNLVRHLAMSILLSSAIVAHADSFIVVSVGGKRFTAKIENSETGRAFMEKLPLTLSMTELNGNEKYNYGVTLPTASKYYSNIEAGDLMLYGSNCVVLFYGAAGGYSYTRIGRLTSTAGLASALGTGSASVTFDKARLEANIKMDGDGLYTQAVTVPGIPVTANSKVDLQPDMEEIEQLAGDGVAALYVENDSGVLTAYAAGAAPSSAMTLQCTVTEVRA